MTFKKIIIRMPNWIGDLVMAAPLLYDLRKAYPEAEITAMCRAPLGDLLTQDPSIDEVYSFSKPQNDFLRRSSQRNIVEKLRIGKYDLGILLTNSLSSAWLFWQGNILKRLGRSRGLFRRFLLTDPVPEAGKQTQHQVDYYKALLAPLGIKPSGTLPRLYVSDEERNAARQLLVQRGHQSGKPLIGINPGAAYGSAKCWPPERFRALAQRLLEEDPEATLLFFGDASSKPLLQAICEGLPSRVIELAGSTDLRELMCLIRECDVLITNDSGPMHIGAAFNVPLIALFGSTDDRITGPYGQPEAVINKRAGCSPCFKRVCPIDFRCMKQIEVDEVVEQALARRKHRV